MGRMFSILISVVWSVRCECVCCSTVFQVLRCLLMVSSYLSWNISARSCCFSNKHEHLLDRPDCKNAANASINPTRAVCRLIQTPLPLFGGVKLQQKKLVERGLTTVHPVCFFIHGKLREPPPRNKALLRNYQAPLSRNNTAFFRALVSWGGIEGIP